MFGIGPRKTTDDCLIPVTFDVTADEYLKLLKKKGKQSWRDFILKLEREKNEKHKILFKK
jgi:predicted CopG family antitoxin